MQLWFSNKFLDIIHMTEVICPIHEMFILSMEIGKTDSVAFQLSNLMARCFFDFVVLHEKNEIKPHMAVVDTRDTLDLSLLWC